MRKLKKRCPTVKALRPGDGLWSTTSRITQVGGSVCVVRYSSYDFGDLGHVIDRIELFRLMVSKYRDQSGEGVSDNVLQATLQAGIQDGNMRDHLALYTGRLDTFEKMVVGVHAIARTRLSFLWTLNPQRTRQGEHIRAKARVKSPREKERARKSRTERAIR